MSAAESRAGTPQTADRGTHTMTGEVCTCGHDRNAHTETGQWCGGNVGSTGRPKTCACDTYEPPRRAHAMTDHAALTQQLDRWEEVARAATPGPWTTRHGRYVFTSSLPASLIGCDEEQDAAHVAAWDPARVLALVTGLRKVVELHSRTDIHEHVHYCKECGDDAPCPTLAAVASVFAGEETSHE